jgi:hypothetical protein
MKKTWIVLIVSIFLSTSWSLVFGAEMAKEGESNYKSAKSFMSKNIPFDKERVEVQIEECGVVVEAKEDSPLYHATAYVLAEMHINKGAYEVRGFIRYTRPDGDQIFAVIDSKGTMAEGMKSKIAFVGGTGKCAGITGTGEWTGVRGIKDAKEGVSMGISIGKFNWKIP